MKKAEATMNIALHIQWAPSGILQNAKKVKLSKVASVFLLLKKTRERKNEKNVWRMDDYGTIN